jgi:hypothetical protein
MTTAKRTTVLEKQKTLWRLLNLELELRGADGECKGGLYSEPGVGARELYVYVTVRTIQEQSGGNAVLPTCNTRSQ